MSIKYIDKNGASHVVSGMTPGGNLETGAVATREGTFQVTLDGTVKEGNVDVTFSDAMPDDEYEVIFSYESQWTGMSLHARAKASTGFTACWANIIGYTGTRTIHYKAFKLYEVADAEALYSDVTDLKTMVPSNASSLNKFATIQDVTGETRSLDRRLDNVEDVVPTTASISNKLATAADVAAAMANAGLKVVDTVPTTPSDGDVILFVGASTEDFEKGGIYQYSSSTASWTLISTADVDLSTYETSWTGTTAQWNAMSAVDKKKYKIANITDDAPGLSVTDAVTNGDMRPITSNAVYDLINQITTATVSVSNATGTLTFKRTGKVVTVYGELTNVTGSTVSLGNSPVGYRPANSYAVGFAAAHSAPYPSSGSIWFYISGNIQLYLPSAGDCYVSATYVTAE